MSKAAQSSGGQTRTNGITRHIGCRALCIAASARAAAKRRGRYALIVTEVILVSLLIAGCGSSSSVAAQVQQLIQQHPWLAQLTLAFLEGLVGAFGWDIGLLLRAAAAALTAGG